MISKALYVTLTFSMIFVIFLFFTGCGHNLRKEPVNTTLSPNINKVKLMGDANHREKPHMIKIPVLMYHYVRDENTVNELIVSTKDFENQMKYLKDNNFKTLSLDELYTILKRKSNPYEKCAVITFDDGYTDNYANAYPILKKYGQTATIFMISDRLNVKPDYFMTSENIIELQANGIDIENHTANHEKLGTIPYDRQLDTIETGKKSLEKVLEKPIKYFAYPYGNYNPDTIKILRDTNHFMAFTTKNGYVTENSDLFQLNRFMIFQTTNLEQFKNIVNTNAN